MKNKLNEIAIKDDQVKLSLDCNLAMFLMIPEIKSIRFTLGKITSSRHLSVAMIDAAQRLLDNRDTTIFKDLLGKYVDTQSNDYIEVLVSNLPPGISTLEIDVFIKVKDLSAFIKHTEKTLPEISKELTNRLSNL